MDTSYLNYKYFKAFPCKVIIPIEETNLTRYRSEAPVVKATIGLYKLYDRIKNNLPHSTIEETTYQSNLVYRESTFIRNIITPRNQTIYRLMNKISEGTFGEVFCGFVLKKNSVSSTNVVAIKISKSSDNPELEKAYSLSIESESRWLRLIDDRWGDKPKPFVDYIDDFAVSDRSHLLCLKIYPYDLARYVTEKKDISIDFIQKISCDVLEGLDFLSNQITPIIHCDIKPDNILLEVINGRSDSEKTYRAKIGDFGVARYGPVNSADFKSKIMAPYFRAPEIEFGLSYSTEIDVWSFAITVFWMFSQKNLFQTDDHETKIEMYKLLIGPIPNHCISYLECNQTKSPYRIFIPLELNPRRIFDSTFESSSFAEKDEQKISELKDFLERHFCWDPSERLRPNQAQNHPFLLDN